jgi:hypothetical protein
MKNNNVSQKFIDAAGGNYVLERCMLMDDDSIRYCRYSADIFTYSRYSLEQIQDDKLSILDISVWSLYEANYHQNIESAGLLEIFDEMKTEYTKCLKQLHSTPAEKTKPRIMDDEDRLAMLKKYVDNSMDVYNTSESSDEDIEFWYSLKWTIGFDGLTIELDNCASVYNAFQQLCDEEGIE